MIYLSIADVNIAIICRSEPFQTLLVHAFKKFIIPHADKTHASLTITVEKTWNMPSENILRSTDWIIEDTRFIFKDSILQYYGMFDIAARAGTLTIRRSWEAAVHPIIRSIVSYYLIEQNSFFLHAACAIKQGGAFLFTGASGTGKTTIANFLLKRGYDILHDDLSCIAYRNGNWTVIPHPFTHGYICTSTTSHGIIKKIWVLEKNTKSYMRQISPQETAALLFYHMGGWVKTNFLLPEKSLRMACKLAREVDASRLFFAYDDRAWQQFLPIGATELSEKRYQGSCATPKRLSK